MNIEDYNKYGRARFEDDWYVLVEPIGSDNTVLAVRIGEKPDEDGNYECDRIYLDSNDPTRVIGVEPREFDQGDFFNPTTEESGGWVA